MEFDRRLRVGQWKSCGGSGQNRMSTGYMDTLNDYTFDIVQLDGYFELHAWSSYNDCEYFTFKIERERTYPAGREEFSYEVVKYLNSFVKVYTMGLLDA